MSRQSSSPNAVASKSTSYVGSGNPRQRHRHDVGVANNLNLSLSDSAGLKQSVGRRRKRNVKRRRISIWRKGLVTEAFRKFGEHCARNQIRTLLIDCLVMTNLLYPSLALYLQKNFSSHPSSSATYNTNHVTIQGQSGLFKYPGAGNPLSLFTLDSLFSSPPPLLPRLTWAGWWERDIQEWKDEGWTVARSLPHDAEEMLRKDDIVWLMRIGWADVADVLDHDVEADERGWEIRDEQLLDLIRNMSEQWEVSNPSSGQGCVRYPQVPYLNSQDKVESEPSLPPCYILSPLADGLYSNVSVIPIPSLTRVNHKSSMSTEDVHLGWSPNTGNIYHTFAIPFHVPRNNSAQFEQEWKSALKDAAKQVQGEVFTEARGPKSGGGDQTGDWFVSYSSPVTPASQQTLTTHFPSPQPGTISSPPTIIIILYAILFFTLMWQLSNASKAHSRFGLAFTGVVQLCCSSVMSFSILALLGWNGWGLSHAESSLPTYILPFVIVVVGAENMSTLTKAIFSIPFTHSVPVRIGLGLSKVGTTISLTSLTDLAVLAIVWLCVNLKPVREFCLFAAVVIITDWFMLQTFFLTVLSIDAQRLELADVLASNKIEQVSSVEQEKDKDEQHDGRQGSLWKNMLRARITKGGSLLLLLFIVALLYWLTDRHNMSLNTTASLYGYTPSSKPAFTSNTFIPTPSSSVNKPQSISALSPAEKLWHALNPQGRSLIQVLVPTASIIVLPKTGHSMLPQDLRKLSPPASRFVIPPFKVLCQIVKIVVFPQAVTAGALYFLLLYLLKDSDLLDAQRNRLGRMDDLQGDEQDFLGPVKNLNAISNNLCAYMLPCSHEADVDFVSSNSEGKVAVSVAIDNTVCLWRFGDSYETGTREPLRTALDREDAIVAVTVSEDGRHIAVCAESGAIQLWEVPEEGAAVPQPIRKAKHTAKIYGMAFDEDETQADDPFTINNSEKASAHSATLLVACGDGSVITVSEHASLKAIPSLEVTNHATSCVKFIRDTHGALAVVVAGQHEVEMWRKEGSRWENRPFKAKRFDKDRITALSSMNTHLPGVFAVGHRSGSVTLFDESYGELSMVPLSTSIGGIRKIEIARPPSMKCTGCGLQSVAGYIVISSTTSLVSLDRIAPCTTSFCRCTRQVSLSEDVSLIAHRNESPARDKPNTLTIPPSNIRSRHASGSSPLKPPSLFLPVSNGDFPLSSHGGSRRLSNIHTKDDDSAFKPLPSSFGRTSPFTLSSNIPTSLNTELEVTSLGGITVQGATGDGWAIIDDDMLIGIRKGRDGIDDDQWQIWCVDLSAPWDATGLVVNVIDFPDLLERSMNTSINATTRRNSTSSISMKDRRTERLLSLNGRASFPEQVGSFSVPTFDALGYVEVCGINKLGDKGLVGGFGNRLGIISLIRPEKKSGKERSSMEGQLGGVGVSDLTPTQKRQAGTTVSPPPPPAKKQNVPSGSSYNVHGVSKLTNTLETKKEKES
ncbi:uncharacterized protein L203_100884 [Cryptococcus depauperatus CBS 7841]|uniref:Sterol regulatory element-binding protein cleavage-activating protein n=1 Tax=Cryptococcus depauperatus CBS 7841 TaxID=1295531 RepID=A0AAJ8JNV1_9TREE